VFLGLFFSLANFAIFSRHSNAVPARSGGHCSPINERCCRADAGAQLSSTDGPGLSQFQRRPLMRSRPGSGETGKTHGQHKSGDRRIADDEAGRTYHQARKHAQAPGRDHRDMACSGRRCWRWGPRWPRLRCWSARQLRALSQYQRPREKKLRLSDVKAMFLRMKDHA
jgi:hypothetical protein